MNGITSIKIKSFRSKRYKIQTHFIVPPSISIEGKLVWSYLDGIQSSDGGFNTVSTENAINHLFCGAFGITLSC